MADLRKYGEATTINFSLVETDGVDLKIDAVHASGDTKIMKDEGAEANTASGFVDEGQGYSLALSATEMEAARITINIIDQGTKAWLDPKAITIETYGHASAQHPYMGEGVWDRQLTGATHNIPASSGRRLRAIGDVVSGSVDDISATTISFITDLTGVHVDHYADQTLLFTSGNLAGMSRSILNYNEITKLVTIEEALPEAPANGDDFDINPVHIHPVSQIVDAVWDETLTGVTHNIADSSGRRVRSLQELGTYENGNVFIDTLNGSAGTTDYESGTIFNKVDNISDANTIAASLNLTGRCVSPGSSITFTASQDIQTFCGDNWTLALGGQSISGTHIREARVSGICTGADAPEFHECKINSVTIPPSHFIQSDMEGIITLPAGEVEFHHCAGEDGFVLDYGATVANTTVFMTDFSGDLIVENLGANGTDILSIRGHGKITLNASCVAGTINWDGHFTIVNNGSGITINSDDISSNVDTLINKFTGITSVSNWLRALFRKDTANATALTEINSGGGAYDESTDSNEALKDQIDTILANGFSVIAGGGTSTPAYAVESESSLMVQGDVVSIARYLVGDHSTKRLFFGAKIATGDASYIIGVIEATNITYSASTGLTSYTIPFVADDTKTANSGIYKGETEIRDADGVSNPVTGDRYDFEIAGEIIT